MDIEAIRAFFMLCTIINVALLAISFLMCASLGDWIYRIHSRWFPMTREAFNVAIYSILGLFKVLVIVFNLVPYIALAIVG